MEDEEGVHGHERVDISEQIEIYYITSAYELPF